MPVNSGSICYLVDSPCKNKFCVDTKFECRLSHMVQFDKFLMVVVVPVNEDIIIHPF